VAVAIAVVFLGEPLGVPLALGALGVVAGGVLLGAERDRPGHLRAVGYAFAAGTAVLFAIRDNLVRDLHAHANPLSAAAATLLAGTIVSMLWMRRVPTRQVLLRMTPAGLCFGFSYVCLFEAFWRGRVTVVSPLVATESLWGVALSALIFRSSENVGSRLAFGALLVVAGGVLIGVYR
jgi:drug/metabolite transporter (DMT)-like permease